MTTNHGLVSIKKLTETFQTSRAVVYHLIRKNGIPQQRRLIDKRYHSVVSLKEFQKVFNEAKRINRHKRQVSIRLFLSELERRWGIKPFSELTTLEMAIYLFIGGFKRENRGLDPTLLQICQGLGCSLTQTAYISKCITRIVGRGHLQRVSRTAQSVQYVITTPRQKVPEEIAFITCPHGTLIDLPWYVPGSNGAGK